VSNDFYELRKSINRRTKICKSMFIINKYKVRSRQRELLEEQIARLKEIDNPYLLKIYELHKDRHRFYIICEFCYGQSLAEVLTEEGSVPERKAALIMHQLLSALAECHRNNVIHTDIKLENIVFNSKEEEIVKITDFSISRIFRIEDVIAQCHKKVRNS
jgi:calcium-dependent protein kinase